MSTVRTDGVALYSTRFLARDRGAGPFHSLVRRKAPPSQAPDPKKPVHHLIRAFNNNNNNNNNNNCTIYAPAGEPLES
jgi:hypothetical protein